MSERKSGIIILGIIAFAALGLGGYSFISTFFSSETPPDSGLILVGLWEDLAENKEYAPYNTDASWLIEFYNSPYNNSNYISVSNNNTTFKLLKEGFYKVNLLLMWDDIDANGIYWAYLYRNDTFEQCFDRVAISANQSSPYHQIESSLFVKSTGLDNFFIRCYCTGDTLFGVTVTQTFNQLSFEYNK